MEQFLAAQTQLLTNMAQTMANMQAQMNQAPPPQQREHCCVRTSVHETCYFSVLLWDVLGELGNLVAPHYHTHHYIRDEDGFRGKRTASAHDSATPFATYSAAISSAARRALFSPSAMLIARSTRL